MKYFGNTSENNHLTTKSYVDNKIGKGFYKIGDSGIITVAYTANNFIVTSDIEIFNCHIYVVDEANNNEVCAEWNNQTLNDTPKSYSILGATSGVLYIQFEDELTVYDSDYTTIHAFGIDENGISVDIITSQFKLKEPYIIWEDEQTNYKYILCIGKTGTDSWKLNFSWMDENDNVTNCGDIFFINNASM